jgi:hypothetical protein
MYRNILGPCASLVNGDIEAFWFAPVEGRRVGFEHSNIEQACSSNSKP